MRIAAVVPTLGASPHLGRCLEALRRDGGEGLEIVVVHQGPAPPALGGDGPRVDRAVALPRPAGFAAATNRGLAATAAELVATVNDDALVEPGWTAALAAALAAEPRAAAAQGTNLVLDRPATVDGRGLAWNRWWQAVQIGHGEADAGGAGAADAVAQGAAAPGGFEEVFGVSATAALFRRGALAAAALAPGEIFDSRLGSYYEDADLACRLRARGWTALSVPAARARHAGGATAAALGGLRPAAVYGNRWLVAARLLGRRFPVAAPRMALRDLADLAAALAGGAGGPAGARGILAGWARAVRHLPAYAHAGPPAVAPAELARLRA
jgi:GT2 family glycosyltransferase